MVPLDVSNTPIFHPESQGTGVVRRCAIINESTGVVENVCQMCENAQWEPPSGRILRYDDSAQIGMIWNGTALVNPEDTPE